MSVLSIKSGIFHSVSGSEPSIQTEEGTVSISETVAPYLGKICELHLHYFPKDPYLGGGGSCLWGETCPIHSNRPEYFLQFKSEGVISYDGGTLKVGSTSVPLDLMEGHYGRLIILQDLPDCIGPDDNPLDSLLKEARDLESLISGLKEVL